MRAHNGVQEKPVELPIDWYLLECNPNPKCSGVCQALSKQLGEAETLEEKMVIAREIRNHRDADEC
ncbi:hypothetical protein GCM10010329_28890 [Streptomyces spiroverticillatus]|uniref:Uncharacterized protein n=1 Tax=Streptomyces finlayi TaxID=67296 RepID=A0A918WVX3_9ACTN|nr:hypothetical protein [Streptomyces finlayi]GHA04482.1 hypothetical protein GCM10010329_28890 [Streptomyces spiroverticillatus]GHC88531.1 hypothetical protein GCM10010334_21300 [Streptomyces finlayi]